MEWKWVFLTTNGHEITRILREVEWWQGDDRLLEVVAYYGDEMASMGFCDGSCAGDGVGGAGEGES